MSIHVQTGNMLDVVYDYDKKGKQQLIGLYDRLSGRTIGLKDPIGFMEVLYKVLKECGEI